ncbi:MAG: hypothetical protein ACFFG0_42225 [Candidatus Thorarchaeota archaeon]
MKKEQLKHTRITLIDNKNIIISFNQELNPKMINDIKKYINKNFSFIKKYEVTISRGEREIYGENEIYRVYIQSENEIIFNPTLMTFNSFKKTMRFFKIKKIFNNIYFFLRYNIIKKFKKDEIDDIIKEYRDDDGYWCKKHKNGKIDKIKDNDFKYYNSLKKQKKNSKLINQFVEKIIDNGKFYKYYKQIKVRRSI